MLICTAGYRRWYSAKISGSTYRQVASLAPRASTPRGVVALSATARKDSPRMFTTRTAYSNSVSPAEVNRTDFRPRSKSFSPYSCSNWRTWALTAGWERKSFWPAREKLPSFAISINVVSWSKSIVLSGDYSRSGLAHRNTFKIPMQWIKNHLPGCRGQLGRSSDNIHGFRADEGKR